MVKHIIYDKLPPYYTSHPHLQFSPVHVIKQSATTDMAAMLSDFTIKTAYITIQNVWKTENTMANFSIGGCATLILYIKTFTYMQGLC